jgi:hypothetical protein
VAHGEVAAALNLSEASIELKIGTSSNGFGGTTRLAGGFDILAFKGKVGGLDSDVKNG